GFAEGAHSVMGRQWLRLLTDVGGPARLMEHCVKWSFGLNTSVILPHTVQRACQLAMAAPKGPVFVSVPTECLLGGMGADAPRAAHPGRCPGRGSAALQPALLGVSDRPDRGGRARRFACGARRAAEKSSPVKFAQDVYRALARPA